MRYFKPFIFCIACVPCVAKAQSIDYFSFSFENDVFYREDGGYTHGMLVSWGYYDVPALDAESLPSWIAYLSEHSYLSSFDNRQYSVSYSMGQFIQTASDIKESELNENDAPYAGLIAWDVNLSAYNEKVADDLSLTLGAVGPISGAKQVQTHLHHMIGANEPMGWEHQLENEFVFRVQAKRLWRTAVVPMGPTELDVITGVNAGVGNLISDANAAVGVRFGQSLASSFASSSPFIMQKLNPLTGSPKGWYLFANLSGAYVLNDIFIDGNTFRDSHSVDLINWQAGAAIGAQLNVYNWNFIYSMVYTTNQYESQSDKSRFGTISITYDL